MFTSQLRAMSHLYLLNRLDKLPVEHLQTLYAQYESLVVNLHDGTTPKKKINALIHYHQQSLENGRSPQAAANEGLNALIQLHANYAVQQLTGYPIPNQVTGWTNIVQLDYVYRRAADVICEGFTAALEWGHSN